MRTPPDKIRQAELAKCHLAKRNLGLDDETYRDVVARVSAKFRPEPVDSAGAMNEAERRALLDEFARLGFRSAPPAEHEEDFIRIPPNHPGAAHLRKLLACAYDLQRIGAVRSDSIRWLLKFIKRVTGVDSLVWLDATAANKVIEGLKFWRKRWLLKHPIAESQPGAVAIPASAIVNAAIYDATRLADEPRSPREGIRNILALLAVASKDLSAETAAAVANLIREFGLRVQKSLLKWDYRSVRKELFWLLARVQEVDPSIGESMAAALKAEDGETEPAGAARGPRKTTNER